MRQSFPLIGFFLLPGLGALLFGCAIQKPDTDSASVATPSPAKTARDKQAGATLSADSSGVSTTKAPATESTNPPATATSASNADAGAASTPSAVASGTALTVAPAPSSAVPDICPERFSVPKSAGKTREVTSSSELKSALAVVQAGERLVLHAGTYSELRLEKLQFTDYLTIESAAGETVEFSGATLSSSDHVVLREISLKGTLTLSGSHDIVLDKVTLDRGDSPDAALMIQGQDAPGANYKISVVNSVIKGGGRTVFVLGKFAENTQWNHDLLFQNNDITCGKDVCFQISGGKNITIEHNQIHSGASTAILTAGANKVEIASNRMFGVGASANQIATPGAEWDNYAGVEHMISSEIRIVNNAMSGWGSGVTLDAATRVDIVNNTIADGTGVRFNHRIPKAQNGDVILTGNSEIRIWNNILPSIVLGNAESRPSFESNNAVKQGGEGPNLITTDPQLDVAQDFALKPGSPARNTGLRNDDTPAVDIDNALRGEKPDLGAKESDASGKCPS